MAKLFGIPINQFMTATLVLLAFGVAIMLVLALRDRVTFKLAVRNIPRRRTQTALVVMGLMLATLLFSASFATGDTLTHSMRVHAVDQLGQVDVVVRADVRETSGRPTYFDQSYVDKISALLSGDPAVGGVAPAILEQAPVVAPASRLSEPRVDILGLNGTAMTSFDKLVDNTGAVLQVDALGAGKAYLSQEAAKKLGVKPGDTVSIFLGSRPRNFQVVAIYVKGANPADEVSMVVPIAQLQMLTGQRDKVNSVLISNKGDALEGARETDAVVASLKPALVGTGMIADPVKKNALQRADDNGAVFSDIFLLFGQFSIIAGILLIFLIYVMLAAERKRELGITRAIGAQRSHIIRMFAFEGAVYALMAAAVGSLFGVLVGSQMVRVLAGAFGQSDLKLAYVFNWKSVVTAFAMGMVFTFVVVLISSWRVSRLNIVRAVRDVPEPRAERTSRSRLVILVLALVVGLLLTVLGLRSDEAFTFYLGTSMIIVGLPLLLRRFGLPDRATFTIAGLGLVAWWLLPAEALQSIMPKMRQGIEMFFLSGIVMVLGGVWAITYNSDLLLKLLVGLTGRFSNLPAILKTAVSYPLQNRFRTGITLAMFSLVVFTLMVMAFIVHSFSSLFDNTELLAGGFDIRAYTSYSNPIADIRAALTDVGGIKADDFEAIGSMTVAGLQLKQDGVDAEPVNYFIQGVDREYSDSVTYEFAMTASGYNSARDVWQALQREPGTAIVAANMVPAKSNYMVGVQLPSFQLGGFYIEDKKLPEVHVTARDLRTGREQQLRVIGVVEHSAFYARGIMTSQGTLDSLVSQSLPSQAYMFRLKSGRDAEAAAKALKARFLENGMQADSLAAEIRKNTATQLMIENLLQGFMALGLVVGIAGLGVIAARSVVERRQQIGILRALGFQKSMVQASFLIESSFVALLGIAIGILLAMGLAHNVIWAMSNDLGGVTYQTPWSNIGIVVVVAYGASLLTTFLPARRAANVYPAEALRYE
ncbi:MAG: FtsX-like permease family protein [Chloroflexi bacterium]|nr:FtsX-like permease family protein [Chloroflexota bacterium]